MCGRYTLRTAPIEYWPTEELPLFVPRYNIAPTDSVSAVRLEDDRPKLTALRWGLIPAWAKDERIGYRTINARCESVADKPAFRSAFQRRRCLILADGFYEWKADGKRKQPHFIRMRNDRSFAFAGLWERWYGPRGSGWEQPIESCTIITTVPNRVTAPIHDRMPVILQPEDHSRWLDPDASAESVKRLLRPFDAESMDRYPVSGLVNKPENDSVDCLKRVSEQRSLF